MSAWRAPTCVLVSGGLDSGLLLHRLLRNGTRLVPLYVRCGLGWEAVELAWLRRFLRAVRCEQLAPLEVIELPVASLYGPHWSLTGRDVPGARTPDRRVYLPGRNVLLVSAAAIVCARRRLRTIALGVLRGNPFADASPSFLRQLARCLSRALQHPVQVLAPLRRFHKPRLIRAAAALPLGLTFSCLRPQGSAHCGRCNKCAERARAFRLSGLSDPTTYAGHRR